MKSVIVFTEKHGDRIFDASTFQKTCAACLTIFNERYSNGWYSDVYSLQRQMDELAPPDVSKEQAATMKNKQLSAQVLESWKAYEREHKRLRRCLDEANKAKRIYEDQDAALAREFIFSRNYYEYEHVEIQLLESAKKPQIPVHFQIRAHHEQTDEVWWVRSDATSELISFTKNASEAFVSSDYEAVSRAAYDLNNKSDCSGCGEITNFYRYTAVPLSIGKMRELGLIPDKKAD